MLEIRWHSRAGQGAVTGAKGLADVVAGTGKEVQAFAFYGSAKRGAAMTAYNRIDEKPILNHEKFMNPDYILVIDPGLTYITNICIHEKPDTKYIITTHLGAKEFLESKPELKGKEVYLLDCVGLSREAFGKSIPNAPMLGALLRVSGVVDLDFFLNAFKKVLGKKLPQRVIDANMEVIKKAHDVVAKVE